MIYKIILILNRTTGHRVCEGYCYKDIDISKSTLSIGLNMIIKYKDGSFFHHEKIEKIEHFERNGLKITTTKKEWFIY